MADAKALKVVFGKAYADKYGHQWMVISYARLLDDGSYVFAVQRVMTAEVRVQVTSPKYPYYATIPSNNGPIPLDLFDAQDIKCLEVPCLEG